MSDQTTQDIPVYVDQTAYHEELRGELTSLEEDQLRHPTEYKEARIRIIKERLNIPQPMRPFTEMQRTQMRNQLADLEFAQAMKWTQYKHNRIRELQARLGITDS